MKHHQFVWILLVALTVACGEKKEPEDENPEGTAEAQGQWTSGCVSNSTPFEGPPAMQRTFSIKKNEMKVVYKLFQTTNCENHLVTLTRKGKYNAKIQKDKTPTANVIRYHLDESVLTYTVTPYSTTVANQLRNYCGIPEWLFKKEVEVTNKNCDGKKLYAAGNFFNLMQINFDQVAIRFGKRTSSHDGATTLRRPIDLEDESQQRE